MGTSSRWHHERAPPPPPSYCIFGTCPIHPQFNGWTTHPPTSGGFPPRTANTYINLEAPPSALTPSPSPSPKGKQSDTEALCQTPPPPLGLFRCFTEQDWLLHCSTEHKAHRPHGRHCPHPDHLPHAGWAADGRECASAQLLRTV